MGGTVVLAVLTALAAAALGWLLTPVLRPFLENDHGPYNHGPEDHRHDNVQVHPGHVQPRQDQLVQSGNLLRLPVAALALLAGLGAASVAPSAAELVAFTAAGVGCSLLVVIDLVARRLPDVLVAGTAAVLLVPLAVAAGTSDAWSEFGRSLLAALALLAGYFLLALIAPSGLGLGDVKFAVVIGAFLGWLGWDHVAAGTVLGFLINGVVALVVLASRSGGRDTQVPFGPSMVLGAVCAVALLH